MFLNKKIILSPPNGCPWREYYPGFLVSSSARSLYCGARVLAGKTTPVLNACGLLQHVIIWCLNLCQWLFLNKSETNAKRFSHIQYTYTIYTNGLFNNTVYD